MRIITAAALALAAALPVAASAKDIVVQMKDRGTDGAMVFEPALIRAMAGDMIRFLPTNPSHNAETIPTMLPAGVASTRGAIGKEFVLRVTAPGLYGIKCLPHYAMGMIALVQVGKGPASNLAAARAATLPPFAAKRMAPLLAAAR
jgi:pseudoazurin